MDKVVKLSCTKTHNLQVYILVKVLRIFNILLFNSSPCITASIIRIKHFTFLSMQYAAKEYQQALDILDMEEPINKRLFEKYFKDESGLKDCSCDWEFSQSSVSKKITAYAQTFKQDILMTTGRLVQSNNNVDIFHIKPWQSPIFTEIPIG